MADEMGKKVPQDPGAMSSAQESPGATPAVGAVSESAAPKPRAASAGPQASPVGATPVANKGDAREEDAEAAMLKMLEDLPEEENLPSADDINIRGAQISKAEFQQLSEPANKSEIRNMDLLLDVNLPVAIELGRTKMSISDILALGPGSVVELNKLAGEPVDLLVNQKIVARGEVVVIDENFGVRITQLVTPQERLQSLAEDD